MSRLPKWRGGANAAFAAIRDKLKPADLVCMAIDSTRPGVISHVEIYIGAGISIGHGGPGKGPTEHQITDWNLLQTATYWTVRRIIPDDQPQEEEDELTPDEHNLLLNINNMLQVKGYPFGYPQATHNALGSLMGEVAGLKKAVSQIAAGDQIDMDAITAAAEKGAKEGAASISAEDIASQLEVKAK